MGRQHIQLSREDFAMEHARHAGDHTSDVYHAHPQYEFYFQYSGRRRFFLEEEQAILGPGDAVLIAPDAAHKTEPAGQTPSERWTLHFTADSLAPLAKAIPRLPGSWPAGQTGIWFTGLDAAQRSAVQTVLEQLWQLRGRNDETADALRPLALGGLLLYLRGQGTACGPCPSAAERLAARVRACVQYRYAEPLQLAQLAEQFGVSPGYLSRSFKEGTGMSLTKYIATVRIRAVQLQLEEKDVPPFQAARQCGFVSAPYFRRVFKQATGLTPRQYCARRHPAP